jgi:hypothetical protein
MGETTVMIQRRIRHWKTSIAGIALLLAPVAAAIWPAHADKIHNAALALGGLGLVSAADAQKQSSPSAS